MEIACRECGQLFTDEPNERPAKLYQHEGEAVCENCLINMGVLPDHDTRDHTRLLIESMWFYHP
jgi:hypothetical protein